MQQAVAQPKHRASRSCPSAPADVQGWCPLFCGHLADTCATIGKPPNTDLYRDIRFSKDKRPYKSQVSAWWARRGMEKTSGGGFYMHVHPKEVVIAADVYMPEREQLLAIRRWMAEHHDHYSAMLKSITRPRKGSLSMTGIEAEAMTRMPKGFAAGHAADELLRARNWGVHLSLPPEAALEPTFSREIAKRFRLAAPLVEALNGAILQAPGTVQRANPRLF